MSYDPDARRCTPLALKLAELIGRDGPISVADYMAACLHDNEHGYYRTQTVIGAAGDFVTAPEISQAFGELIGLWCAVVWQQMGQPAVLHLVELGPGRGTMMRDALRAARVVPDFVRAVRPTLIESNPHLARVQQATLRDAPASIEWLDSVDGLFGTRGSGAQSIIGPGEPVIVIGNEFLDVLPIEQFVRGNDEWFCREVALDRAGMLCWLDNTTSAGPDRRFGDVGNAAAEGTIFEMVARDACRTLPALFERLGKLNCPTAGLFIDYGHATSTLGCSLQAVRAHAFEHPLTSPGEADLTAQVDFAAFAASMVDSEPGGEALVVDGPITQAQFLGRLGIIERASRLMASNPHSAGEIEAGVARLMSPGGMGSRFKVIGVRSARVATLPAFAVDAVGSRSRQ